MEQLKWRVPVVATHVWVDEVNEQEGIALVEWVRCLRCDPYDPEQRPYKQAAVSLSEVRIAKAGDCPYVAEITEDEARRTGVPISCC
jgi:hypothetical protein